jgi:hypothetical protein
MQRIEALVYGGWTFLSHVLFSYVHFWFVIKLLSSENIPVSVL